AGPNESGYAVDWIEQALTAMSAEQRACVAIPALFENGMDRLAAFLGCSPAQAMALRGQVMGRLRATLSEADTDSIKASAPVLSEAALIDALTDVADRALSETNRPRMVWTARIWLRRVVMLTIAALVLAPGVVRIVFAPLGASWQEFGAIEFIDGRLRRIGRGSVTAAQWSPDGMRIILATTTGLYAVEAATLRPVGYAPTEPGIRLLGFNQAGTQIATWRDGALVLRDFIDLRPVYTAAALEWRGATTVAWDWTHETLAVGQSQDVALIEPRAGGRHRLYSIASAATHLRFSPDGGWLAATTAMPETLLIKTDGARMFGIGGNAHAPIATAFSGDGRHLIGVFGDGLAVADFDQRAWVMKINQSGLTPSLWFSADGKHAIVGAASAITASSEVLTFNLDTGQVTRSRGMPGDRSIGVMAVREDGARVLIINADGLSIWDLNTGALIAASVDFAPPLRADSPAPVRFSDDGRHLVAPDAFGGMRVLVAASGRTERAFNEFADPFVEAIFSPDGQRIVAEYESGVGLRPLAPGDRTRQREPALYVFDVASGRTTHVFPGARQPQFIAPSLVSYLPSERSELRAYDFSTGMNQAWTGVRAEHPNAFVASADATRVAVLTDRTLELWDPATGLLWRSPLATTAIDRGLLGRPLAMSSDGRIIAVAEPSLGIRVYAGETGVFRGLLARPITVTFDSSLENPLKVAASADGRWFATVDNRPTFANTGSSTLTVWRADTLRAVQTRAYDQMRVTGIAFSPDNRRLAVLRADYVIDLLEQPYDR
ncbi:MAG: WD40 repeat domain-containing protein, partial [Thermoflexales bacterium]